MIPVVWLLGTSGVGKTSTGWALQQALQNSGVLAAFVDADQLRLVAGTTTDEASYVAEGLAVVGRTFAEAGVTVLIVSGVADGADHVARLVGRLAAPAHLAVLLSASDDAIIERIGRRGWMVEAAQESITYGRTLIETWDGVTADTTGLSIDEAARRLVEPVTRFLATAPSARNQGEPTALPVPELTVLTGPRASGVSTLGFSTYLGMLGSGEPIAYLDTRQLGLTGDTPDADDLAALRARNTLDVAAGMARHGVPRVLVAADHATARALHDAGHGSDTIWLNVPGPVLAERVQRRAHGEGPPLVGDALAGTSGDGLVAALDRAAREAVDPSIRTPGARLVDADDEVDAVVARIVEG